MYGLPPRALDAVRPFEKSALCGAGSSRGVDPDFRSFAKTYRQTAGRSPAWAFTLLYTIPVGQMVYAADPAARRADVRYSKEGLIRSLSGQRVGATYPGLQREGVQK